MKLFAQILAYLNFAEIELGSILTFVLYEFLNEKDYKKISILSKYYIIKYFFGF